VLEEKERDQTLIKLIFWLLAAMFAVLTTIGGATASHVVGQGDEANARLSRIEANQAAEDVYRSDVERRLEAIERRLNESRR
jgi:hypothetical protein